MNARIALVLVVVAVFLGTSHAASENNTAVELSEGMSTMFQTIKANEWNWYFYENKIDRSTFTVRAAVNDDLQIAGMYSQIGKKPEVDCPRERDDYRKKESGCGFLTRDVNGQQDRPISLVVTTPYVYGVNSIESPVGTYWIGVLGAEDVAVATYELSFSGALSAHVLSAAMLSVSMFAGYVLKSFLA